VCEAKGMRKADGSLGRWWSLDRQRLRQNLALPHRPLGALNSGYNGNCPRRGRSRGWHGVIHKNGWRSLRRRRRFHRPEGFRRVFRARSAAGAALGRPASRAKVWAGCDPRPGTGAAPLSMLLGAGKPISAEGNAWEAGRVHGRNPVLRSCSAFRRERRPVP
jgi:hypothetical protein